MTSNDPWLFTQLTLYAPGFWLLLSLVLTLVLGLVWGMISPNRKELVLLARYVALPYGGLLLGGLSPRFMGLNGLDWLVSFSLGIGLILVMLLALAFARLTVAFANPLNHRPALAPVEPTEPHSGLIDSKQASVLSTVAYSLFRSGAEEFHWAFLRGAIWELLLIAPVPPALPIYWAVWAAAGLALPDILLSNRTALRRFLRVVVLITTSILFLYTRNFWLGWMLHAAGWTILASGFSPQNRRSAAVERQHPALKNNGGA